MGGMYEKPVVTGVLEVGMVEVGEVDVEVEVLEVVVGIVEVGAVEDGISVSEVVGGVVSVVVSRVVLAEDLHPDASEIEAIAAPPAAILTRFKNCRRENLVTR